MVPEEKTSSSITYENPIVFFMWLPCGKDIFGKADRRNGAEADKPDMTNSLIEYPIAERIRYVIKDKYSGIYCEGKQKECLPITSSNELYSRMICSEFKISESKYEISGQFRAYSNGLYMWLIDSQNSKHDTKNLNILDNDESEKKLKEIVINHIYKLFHKEWRLIDGVDKYDGLLNFDQIELLFDGIFNKMLDPEIFFISKDISDKYYKMEFIINKLLLFLNSEESYSVSNDSITYRIFCKSSNDSRNIEFSLNEQCPEKAPEIQLHSEEIIATLSYAAMEHFVRTSIFENLYMHRNGVMFAANKILANSFSMKVYEDYTFNERPSFEKEFDFSELTIEAYMSLVTTTFPLLSYLKDLIDDLASTKYSDNNHKEHEEKDCSENIPKTSVGGGTGRGVVINERIRAFKAAKRQFDRQLNTIKEELKTVNEEIIGNRSDKRIEELSSIRKLLEIALEQNTASSNARKANDNKSLDNIKKITSAISILSIAFAGIIAGKDNVISRYITNSTMTFNDLLTETIYKVAPTNLFVTIGIILLFIIATYIIAVPTIEFSLDIGKILQNGVSHFFKYLLNVIVPFFWKILKLLYFWIKRLIKKFNGDDQSTAKRICELNHLNIKIKSKNKFDDSFNKWSKQMLDLNSFEVSKYPAEEYNVSSVSAKLSGKGSDVYKYFLKSHEENKSYYSISFEISTYSKHRSKNKNTGKPGDNTHDNVVTMLNSIQVTYVNEAKPQEELNDDVLKILKSYVKELSETVKHKSDNTDIIMKELNTSFRDRLVDFEKEDKVKIYFPDEKEKGLTSIMK